MKVLDQLSRLYSNSRGAREIYRTHDELGEIIVSQLGDKRILSFGSSLEQSSVLMSKPYQLSHEYTQIMLLGLLFVDAKQTTILGLGGGGLAHCLSHYFPNMMIQVVEKRQAVIDVAYQWFELPQHEQLQVINADAFQFSQSMPAGKSDLIMSDLYDAQGVSELQHHVRFIETLHSALSDEGCLVLNYHQQPDQQSLIATNLNKLFAHIYVCNVFRGNRIIFCCKRSQAYDSGELKQCTKSLINTVSMPLIYYSKQLKRLN